MKNPVGALKGPKVGLNEPARGGFGKRIAANVKCQLLRGTLDLGFDAFPQTFALVQEIGSFRVLSLDVSSETGD